MRNVGFRLLIALLFVFTSQIVLGSPCREVVGYYAGWKWYKRNKLVNPETINYSKYTIINYAFFKPLENGTVTEGDSWADKNILLGKAVIKDGITTFDASSSLVNRAHQNGVRVVGSIGGWTWSSVFPGIASDPLKRKRFAQSCVALCVKYQLDGIDIDWEYPGFKAHNGSNADAKNFTLLLSEIRNGLDDYGKTIGKKFLLSAAFGPSPDHMKMIEWNEVQPLLDLIHVMTYNYYGSWDKVTNHNAPLYAPLVGSNQYNVHSSISHLVNFYHVDPSKITLGVAFYGRSVTMLNETALHATSTGIPDGTSFPEEKGTPSYYNIVKKLNAFNLHRDRVANVPYLLGKKSFVSFDDPVSIEQKADYAVQNNLRGVVIWDISGDYIETFPGSGILQGNPLCDAIESSFCRALKASVEYTQAGNIGLVVYPNPFMNEFVLNWNSDCQAKEIVVLSQSGQVIFQNSVSEQSFLKIDTGQWASGIYFLKLLTSSGETVERVVKL